MVLSLWNDDPTAWTNCRLELPGNLFYTLSHLSAGDHESIALSNFVQQGPERDVLADAVTVRCAQGSGRFVFPY
jgi:hypothetical protein